MRQREKAVYVASDNSLMSKNDLETWLKSIDKFHPERKNWSFDELTGGKGPFLNEQVYETMKMEFHVNKSHLQIK